MLKNLILGAAIGMLLAVASAIAAPAAYVHELTGTATAKLGSAPVRALHVGDTIEQGTRISTGEKSTAVIKFEDGQLVVLQQRTTFLVSEYRYVQSSVKDSSIVMSLVSGAMRFVTGVIGSTNHGAVKISAGTSTIGIRGTDGTVILDPVTAIVVAAVNAGAIAMSTPAGTTDVSVGQFASAGSTGAPSSATPTAEATAAVAQTLSNLATVALPVNTPVVVDASAKAAAAKAASDAAAARAAAAPNDPAAKAAADAAKAAADTALATAVTEAQNAVKAAESGGAVTPAPSALPSLPAQPQQPAQPPASPPAQSTGAGGTGCTVSCN